MQRQQQPVLGLPQTQQPRPKQRPMLQIERLRRFFLRPSLRLGLTLPGRQRAQILELQFERNLGCNHLHRHRVFHLEPRAQHLVPPHHFAQRRLQCVDVQRPHQTHDRRHVVHRPTGQQPVHQP